MPTPASSLSISTVVGVSLAYIGFLFLIAWWGDKKYLQHRHRCNAKQPSWRVSQPLIYSLTLGVYCTSWTFYGGVGTAITTGWAFLPIYLGPALFFLLFYKVLRKALTVSRQQHITSLADFVATRYGKDPALARLVTLIAVLGSVPYIALQLKAIASSFDVLTGNLLTQHSDAPTGWGDTGLNIALFMVLFAILFGTRDIHPRETHRGLTFAIAFESLFKLITLIILAIFVMFVLHDGPVAMLETGQRNSQVHSLFSQASITANFITQTGLAFLAMLCLPRQFHVAIVENTNSRDVRSARWLFPGYLLLASLVIAIIAYGGMLVSSQPVFAPDTFVLTLPLVNHQPLLALLVFLGGVSAATGMVIVATVALSTMVSNDLILPLLLRSKRLALYRRGDYSTLHKTIRRLAIAAIMLLGYSYYRLLADVEALAAIGLLAFAAAAQFSPAVFAALYWHKGTAKAARYGLTAGFFVWGYCLLTPTLINSGLIESDLLSNGPLGIAWLRPQQLFGLETDPLTNGVFWSLAINAGLFYLFSRFGRQTLTEREQAAVFTRPGRSPNHRLEQTQGLVTTDDLLTLAERFLGEAGKARLLNDLNGLLGRPPTTGERASRSMIDACERQLAASLGSATGRHLIHATRRGGELDLSEFGELVVASTAMSRFNRELLEATLQHLSQGVSVVDENLNLVAWNKAYVDMFQLPEHLLSVGQPIEAIIRFNAERGFFGRGDIAQMIATRLAYLRSGKAHRHERHHVDGRVVEILGNPLPNGGFVTAFTDITEFKRTERELAESATQLEQRVQRRTHELSAANQQLALAQQDKTRFFAAASHDLMQPLNAARLYAASISTTQLETVNETARQIESALNSSEQLLSTLIEIARLDSGRTELKIQNFPIAEVMQPLYQELLPQAAAKQQQLRYVATSANVRSDPALLRRILQNLLSNAIRYAGEHGHILFGCRRSATHLTVQVWDNGPGMTKAQCEEIFQEFHRLPKDREQGTAGFGLGLSIVRRMSDLLKHPITVSSHLGRGSMFAVNIPLADAETAINTASTPCLPNDHLVTDVMRPEQPQTILCIDNDPQVLDATHKLLTHWGYQVLLAHDLSSARQVSADGIPDKILADYQLDDGVTGLAVVAQLYQDWGKQPPCIVITANREAAVHDAIKAAGHWLIRKPASPAALRSAISV